MPAKTKNGILTTGQISKAVGVSPRTVTKWIDSGLLKGWRIPGSKDRRVDYKDLKLFCIEQGLPLEYVVPEDEIERLNVWILDDKELLYPRLLQEILHSFSEAKVEYVEPHDLSFRFGLDQPTCVIINYDVEGRETVMSIAKILPVRTKLVILHSDEMSQTARNVFERIKNIRIIRY